MTDLTGAVLRWSAATQSSLAFEPGGEIVLHLPHEVADEGLQVVELGAVLSGDDEAELVAVAAAAFEERFAVRLVARGVVEFARLTFARDAVALEVAQVRPRRAEIGPLEPNHPGLDDDPSPSGAAAAQCGDAPVCAPAADPRAGEARPAATAGRADRLLGGAQNARDVGDSLAAFAVADASELGADLVVACGHERLVIIGLAYRCGQTPAFGKLATKTCKMAARLAGYYRQSGARCRHFLDVQATASTMEVGTAFISPTIPSAALLAHSSDILF